MSLHRPTTLQNKYNLSPEFQRDFVWEKERCKVSTEHLVCELGAGLQHAQRQPAVNVQIITLAGPAAHGVRGLPHASHHAP
jgi:hypothetical protein